MKKIIFYFLALLFAVWLGVVMHRNPGYVLISVKDMSVETSLWFFVITIILLFFIIYALLRFSSGASRMTSYISHWFSDRRERRAHQQTILGLYELVEGNWRGAEKKLIHFAKHSDMSLVNYLAAALMAQRQHEFKRRDNYLRLAQKVASKRPLTVGLAQAVLQIGNEQWEGALVELENLYRSYPKNSFVLELLQKVYLELGDWYGLKKMLPSLRKRKLLSVENIDQLEEKVYGELLLAGIQNHKIADVWDDLPRYLKKNPFLVSIYAQHLLDNGKDDDVDDLLKMVLRKNLDERLLYLYSALSSSKPIKHLMRAEKWLEDKPKDVGLLLCLGRICRKQKLWGKARHYLEESVKIKPTLTAYAELGQLMSEQDDLRSAIDFYEKGIKQWGQV